MHFFDYQRIIPIDNRKSVPFVFDHGFVWGTPKQVEHLEDERASRDASKRASLMRRCAVPSPKTFGGYDWTAASWPDGFGRDDLLSLSFLDGREDLVLMGDVGTTTDRKKIGRAHV